MSVIWLSAKKTVIFRSFWSPRHYDASHHKPLEASVNRKIAIFLGLMSTFCDLPWPNLLVCICHSCLIDPTIFVQFFMITIKKLDFIIMRFHHAIQHNIWNFSSDLSLKIEKLSHKFKNVFTDLIFLRAKKKNSSRKIFWWW